jgi:hypothetical protein
MSEVFIAETGQLTPRSIRDLRKAGIVVVEVADATKASFVRASEIVSADDMLWAALDAIGRDDSWGNKARAALSSNLLKVVVEARQKRRESA